MNRNAHRGDVHFYNALHVPLRKICHCNVVPVKEGEAGIVILKIDGLAHTLRVLINEAEDAAVGTAALFIHKGCIEFKADIGVLPLEDMGCVGLAVTVECDAKIALCEIKTVIKHVVYLIAVDGYQHVSAAYSGSFCK